MLTVFITSSLGPAEVIVRCHLNHIQCPGTRKCIHFNKLCNGAKDCTDGFDEGVHCRGKTQHPYSFGSCRCLITSAVTVVVVATLLIPMYCRWISLYVYFCMVEPK